MAGGHMKYRTLGRKSSHRQALLRNLVTALFQHESITTTWAKAKETQRLADKLVTLGKRNTEAARNRAKGILFDPSLLPRLFGAIRERYAARPGGYTRVLRLEPRSEDQAPSALLELVDSPRDTRFALTARTLAFQRRKAGREDVELNEMTRGNVVKVTRFRENGERELEELTRRFQWLDGKREEAEEKQRERVEQEDKGEIAWRERDRRRRSREKEEWEDWLMKPDHVERKRRVYPELPRTRL